MDDSFREQRCGLCRTVFYVCRGDDHGQIYCPVGCSAEAWRRSRRAARARQQGSELGRQDHRDHMRALRERRAEAEIARRVTDQGPQEVAPSAIVVVVADPAAPASGARESGAGSQPDAETTPSVQAIVMSPIIKATPPPKKSVTAMEVTTIIWLANRRLVHDGDMRRNLAGAIAGLIG